MAERWRMCPYTIIAFSVNGYVSLTAFTSFTPLPTRHFIKSIIEITPLTTTYRSMITAITDIDLFIIQLSTLMAAEKSSETNWRTRRVATMRTIITTTGGNDSIRRLSISEYDRDIESNVIPTSQLSAISSQRSYNGRDASRPWWRLWQVQDSTLPTREIEYHSHKPMERDHQSGNLQSMTRSYRWISNTENRRRSQQTIANRRIVCTYSSSNLEEAWRTANTTNAIGRVSEWWR